MRDRRDSLMLAKFEHDSEMLDLVERMLDLASSRKKVRGKPAASTGSYTVRSKQKSKRY